MWKKKNWFVIAHATQRKKGKMKNESKDNFNEFMVEQTDCTNRNGWPCITCAADFFGLSKNGGGEQWEAFVPFWQLFTVSNPMIVK